METFNNTTNIMKDDIFEFKNCSLADENYFPSSKEFFEALGPAAWIILGLASAAFLVISVIYLINIIYVCRKIQSQYLISTNVVLSAYMGVALCTFLQIFVPRANLILDIISNLWLVFCIYHFYKLTIAYFGGQKNMVICLEGKSLQWRGPPCCCLPCFWPCLPKGNVEKGQVKFLGSIILQHPILQAFFAVVTVTLYIEGWIKPPGNSIYDPYLYINIITGMSFFLALYGFIVIGKASKKPLSEFRYFGKVVSLQFCIIIVRFQNVIFSLILLPLGVFPCIKPISPGVYANLVLSCLVLGQLVTVSVAASYFYRVSVADKKAARTVVDDESSNPACNLL